MRVFPRVVEQPWSLAFTIISGNYNRQGTTCPCPIVDTWHNDLLHRFFSIFFYPSLPQDAKNGWTPLFHAIINQNQRMITRLIEAGAQVNAQSYSGNTALHVATGRGYTSIVRLLMRYGADMSVKNTHRESPAMISNNRMVSYTLEFKSRRKKNVKIWNF